MSKIMELASDDVEKRPDGKRDDAQPVQEDMMADLAMCGVEDVEVELFFEREAMSYSLEDAFQVTVKGDE